MKSLIAAAVVLGLLIIVRVQAESLTWDGGPTGTGTNWFAPENWDPDGTPDILDDLVVLTGTPTTVGDLTTARSLLIDGGAVSVGDDYLLASLGIEPWLEIKSGSLDVAGVMRLSPTGTAVLKLRADGVLHSGSAVVRGSSGRTDKTAIEGEWTNDGLMDVAGDLDVFGTIRTGGLVVDGSLKLRTDDSLVVVGTESKPTIVTIEGNVNLNGGSGLVSGDTTIGDGRLDITRGGRWDTSGVLTIGEEEQEVDGDLRVLEGSSLTSYGAKIGVSEDDDAIAWIDGIGSV